MRVEKNNPIEKKLKNEILLDEIFRFFAQKYPDYTHDEEKFKECLRTTLKEDPMRNSSLIEIIEKDGMNFKINKEWPLNDFLYAASDYLISIGVPQEKAEKIYGEIPEIKQSLFK